MKMYILSIVENEEDGTYSIIGVFDNEKRAIKTAEALYEEKNQQIYYFIEEYEVNHVYPPDEDYLRKKEEAIEELVKEGVLDYTIGEDGRFYFSLTEKGKRELE